MTARTLLDAFARGRSRHLVLALSLLILVFIALFVHGLFIHNDDVFVATAAFYDSGSILSSLFVMQERENFYNQNGGYHTRCYGWTPNALLFPRFALMRHLFGLDPVDDFRAYAIVARLDSFLFSLASLALLCLLVKRLTKNDAASILAAVVFACFSPFVILSRQVHPEPAGTFFVLLCFRSLLRFFEQNGETRSWLEAVFFAALAALSKPPFAAIFLAVGAAYAVDRVGRSRSSLPVRPGVEAKRLGKATLIVILTTLAIHPYLFIQIRKLRFAVGKLAELHSPASFDEWLASLGRWTSQAIAGEYVVLIGLIASLFWLFRMRRGGDASRRTLAVMSVYNVGYCAWLFLTVKHQPWSMTAYLYPAYPTLILAGVGAGQEVLGGLGRGRWREGKLRARVGAAAICVVLSVNAAYHAVVALSHVTDQLTLEQTPEFTARSVLLRLGRRPWRVIYFPSVPVPGGCYDEVLNAYGLLGPEERVAGVVTEFGADVMVVDHEFIARDLARAAVKGARVSGLIHEYGVARIYPRRRDYWYAGVFDFPSAIRQIRQNVTRGSGQRSEDRDDYQVTLLTKTPLLDAPESLVKKP